ncbi:hypothetical protein NLG97_g4501 [Lecanicillium saksenae]|uniref:Uncharacterized protein n=1 Tax=Lecanicillium saksenae TaxID=468837 RepID=A0ACC1QVN8_9HYPO|nr:hypothetical protein NLG97_g4501 [Lecanicillium saksenae]
MSILLTMQHEDDGRSARCCGSRVGRMLMAMMAMRAVMAVERSKLQLALRTLAIKQRSRTYGYMVELAVKFNLVSGCTPSSPAFGDAANASNGRVFLAGCNLALMLLLLTAPATATATGRTKRHEGGGQEGKHQGVSPKLELVVSGLQASRYQQAADRVGGPGWVDGWIRPRTLCTWYLSSGHERY